MLYLVTPMSFNLVFFMLTFIYWGLRNIIHSGLPWFSNFSEIAKQKSKGTTASDGGDLGYKEIFDDVMKELTLIVEKIREKKIEPKEDYIILFIDDLI
mgnify:CR=1 FL=1